MTRDEALRLLNKHNDDDVASVDVIKQFINQVYDDFESRTCENCEFYKEENKQCTNEASIAYTSQEAIYFDDGCNKFEKKD